MILLALLLSALQVNALDKQEFDTTVSASRSVGSIVSADDWQYAVSKAENAVVQIIAQSAQFNWQQPFRSPEQKQGAGSGFIIDQEGYILTNYHVVNEATSAYAFVPALGRQFLDVEIIGTCPESDVALLKFTAESLSHLKAVLGKVPVLTLGNSDALYHAEPVLALGYPLGQRYVKSTVGEIAGREFRGGRSYMHITAPINPGNSGGPLLNKAGEVVGINTAIMTNSQNFCLMVPIDDIKILLHDLYSNKLLFKARLGVGFNTSTPEHAKHLNNPVPSGLYINYVEAGSVADAIGIKAGDMLYQVNEYVIDHYGDVHVGWRSSSKVSFGELLIRFAIGEKISLVVYRNGTRLELSGTFEKKQLKPIRFIYPEFESHEVDYELFGGMCVMQLRENHFEFLHQSYEMNKYARRENVGKEVLVITHILPGSIIDKVDCFYPGFLIETINDQPVKNLQELRAALKKSLETGHLAIGTHEKYSTVISLDKLLQDEPRISNSYMVPITKTVQELMNAKQ